MNHPSFGDMTLWGLFSLKNYKICNQIRNHNGPHNIALACLSSLISLSSKYSVLWLLRISQKVQTSRASPTICCAILCYHTICHLITSSWRGLPQRSFSSSCETQLKYRFFGESSADQIVSLSFRLQCYSKSNLPEIQIWSFQSLICNCISYQNHCISLVVSVFLFLVHFSQSHLLFLLGYCPITKCLTVISSPEPTLCSFFAVECPMSVRFSLSRVFRSCQICLLHEAPTCQSRNHSTVEHILCVRHARFGWVQKLVRKENSWSLKSL